MRANDLDSVYTMAQKAKKDLEQMTPFINENEDEAFSEYKS